MKQAPGSSRVEVNKKKVEDRKVNKTKRVEKKAKGETVRTHRGLTTD